MAEGEAYSSPSAERSLPKEVTAMKRMQAIPYQPSFSLTGTQRTGSFWVFFGSPRISTK